MSYYQHFNDLTPGQAERLALLLEELGEAQQAIGKILRHGYNSRHPDGGPTNQESLEREMGDVLVALEMLYEGSDLSRISVLEQQSIKSLKIKKHLHHQW